jgi:hypothetical protein
MRTRSFYGSITAMTIAGALTLSAQTPSTPQTQTTPKTGDQRSASEQTVTVTGCLQQNSGTGMSGSGSAGSTGSTGSATSGGTGSTAGSTSAGASGSSQGRSSNFVLANAKMAQGSSTSGLGTATRLSLTGMSDSELSKHLNHQVEVTGRLSGAMSGTTGTTGAAGTTGSATGSTGSTGSTGTTGTTARSGGAAGMGDMPQLHATNLKMISATCPAQQ